MKTSLLSMALTCIIATSGYTQTINPSKSKISFEISNMLINTVEGTFSGMKGTVIFSEKDWSAAQFDVCIDAASVNTDNQSRDEHLRSVDFFDTAKYPDICFKSSTISKAAGGYVVQGSLTMRGITKDVNIPFAFSDNVLSGILNINRLDYKVGEDTGTAMVGDEVKITIICALN